MMTIYNEILSEVERATVKFPTWPTDPLHALAVLGEEYGELNKAMLQLTYEPHKTNLDKVRMEAIQTAAMALRLAMSLDTYEYAPSGQHSQGALASPERDRSDGELLKESDMKWCGYLWERFLNTIRWRGYPSPGPFFWQKP